MTTTYNSKDYVIMHEPNNVTHSFFAAIFLLIHKRKMISSTMPAIRRKVIEPRTLPMTTAEFIVCSELGAVILGTVGSEAKIVMHNKF